MPYQSSESQAESKLATGGEIDATYVKTKKFFTIHGGLCLESSILRVHEQWKGRVRAGECQSNDPGGNTEHPRIHKEWDELLPECLSQLKTDGDAEQEEELSWTTNWLEKYTGTSVLHMDYKSKYADGRHHQSCWEQYCEIFSSSCWQTNHTKWWLTRNKILWNFLTPKYFAVNHWLVVL